MKRVYTVIVLLIACSFMLSSCGPPEQPAATLEITSATPILTNTPIPSDNATPLPTDTPTAVPTDTPTIVPTDTPLPTNTPTITPTPGPFSFNDDFTTNSGDWEDCELCSWENEALLMGPFLPSSNFHKNYCTGCGVRTYYEVSVDGTFIDGQVDRFFGVFVGDAKGKQYYFGISPWQFYIIGQHTDEGDSWEVLDFQWSGTVNGSYATNHFKITIKPAYQPNTADYLFSLNDSIVYIIYGIPVGPSKVGLGMDWHAVTVSYDNWQYVEIEP